VLKAKLGDAVRKGSVLFQIHAERAGKLEPAFQLAERLQPFVLSRKAEERMLLDQIPAKVTREKPFMLER
jgi:thymidine phosphorylase